MAPGGDEVSRTVVVQTGDTLSRIGRVVGVPWLELAAANGIKSPWTIRPGQVLVVPGQPEPAPSTAEDYRLQVGPFTAHRWARTKRVRWIVMHDPVGGSPGGTLAYLRRNALGVSYHYLILPPEPGRVPVAVCLAEPGQWCVGHAGVKSRIPGTLVRDGDVNEATIGVSLYKHTSDYGPFPESMVKAAADLVSDLINDDEYELTDAGVVLAHREVSPGRRSDPRGLDMTAFRANVAARL